MPPENAQFKRKCSSKESAVQKKVQSKTCAVQKEYVEFKKCVAQEKNVHGPPASEGWSEGCPEAGPNFVCRDRLK
jgi:hypothetical protein